MTVFISRRELLKRVGIAGAASVVPADVLRSVEASPLPSAAQAPGAASVRPPLENLTASEAGILDAIVSRLIPSDEHGPGALEAGATHYIDRALGGALASSRRAYQTGLAALDQFAHASLGKSFVELSPAAQDTVLVEVEGNKADGFPEGSAAFFALVRTHTIQGTFCDPVYGGNANFAGWDLIGYPGVRTIVTSDEQRLGADVAHNHKSAYDYEMFTKTSASTDARHGTHNGD